MTSQYPSTAPPGYSDSAAEPLLVSNDATAGPSSSTPAYEPPKPRTEDDHIPDDFKYGEFVSDCELSIRQAFVRKVYTILACQLFGTTAIASCFIFFPALSHWALTHSWTLWVSMFLSFGLMMGAFFMARKYPMNLVLLGLFTVVESYMIGFVTAQYDTRIVVQALAITVVLFAGLTGVAMTAKYDFTKWYKYAFAALFLLLGIGIVQMFVPFSSKMELLYSSLGAFVFAVYILIDTQLIMNQFHPEDEVIGAITLYLDIINLFLYILRILTESNDN